MDVTDEQIAELRKLHAATVAQDLGRLDDPQRLMVPVYRENAAFMVECNNRVGRLLEEREDLMRALGNAAKALRFVHGHNTCAEQAARDVLAKVEAP